MDPQPPSGDLTVPLGTRRLRVLVVDDHRDSALTLGILLRSEGIEVELASGGLQVPEAVAQFEPDVILLKVAMPDRGGVEVAKELRQRHGDRCPVLIALTANSTDADSVFQHRVAKPYDPDALLKLVKSFNPR